MPAPAFVDAFEPLDDFILEPTDGEKLLTSPSYSVTLDVAMDNLGDGVNYAFFNENTYVLQKVPTLYTALTTREFATNPLVYGVNSNSFVLNHMDVVEIILNNNDPGKHPFHLHGHNFQLVHRSEDDAGAFDSSSVPEANMPEVPMKRDVVLAPPNGNIVIRFRADNPGIWLFHCHLEWHLVSVSHFPLNKPAQLSVPKTLSDMLIHLTTSLTHNRALWQPLSNLLSSFKKPSKYQTITCKHAST